VTPLANVSCPERHECFGATRAGAAEPVDHFVENQQQTVLVANCAQPLEITLR